MSYERALAAIKADLDRIPDASRWCYHNGYWPLRPDHDRPTPLHDPTMPADYVPGAIHDHGLGAYQCRAGWVAARGHLASADQQIAAMFSSLGFGRVYSPLCLRAEDRHESDVPKYALSLIRGVTLIQAAVSHAGPDMREWVSDSLTNPYGPVWRAAEAYAELSTHHHRAGDEQKPVATVAMCPICRINAAAPPSAKKGGKCHSCHQRIWRDGAQEVVLIRAEAAAEIEAAKQRRSRQCGYGAA